MELGPDPPWWSAESSMSSSTAHEKYDPKLINPLSQPQRLQVGDVLYKYGLSRELTMEVVQVVIAGYESKTGDIEQICVTAQLFGITGEPLSQCIVGTTYSNSETKTQVTWGELLVLPFKISDIPQSATLSLAVWGPPENSYSQNPILIGTAKFSLFSREGRLRIGKQELEVYHDWSTGSFTPHEQREEELERIWSKTTIDYEKEEAQRREASMTRVSWLNRMAEDRLRQIRRWRRQALNEKVRGILAIELFDYGVPIIFESEDDFPQILSATAIGGTGQQQISGHFIDDGELRQTGSEVKYPELLSLARNEASCRNVVEEKCYAMRRSMTRKSGGEDPNLRPNVDDLAQIERILGLLTKPRNEDEDLLWKFRHALVRNSKALTKVLASVKWDNEDEVLQARRLLDKWESAELCDVLRLLSDEPEFSHPVVRAYAVKVLSGTGNAVLQLYMPQLVQALRYDAATASKETVVGTTVVESVKEMGLLQDFLIRKCAENEDLASCLYWLLKVECALENSSTSQTYKMFGPVMDAFNTQIAKHPHVQRTIRNQDAFVSRFMDAARKAANMNAKQSERTKALRLTISKHGSGVYNDPILLAGFPGKRIVSVREESARIMNSNTSPAVIDFVLQDNHNSPSMEESTFSVRSGAGGMNSVAREPPTIRIMFKVGDDLRQDQLILQLIELMDNIFRENGLDLEMTIYRVLATAPREGLVEFVPDAVPLSRIKNDYGSIVTYLARQELEYGGKKAVIERFIRSSAGYAVATYVLGIGDRHLDNIMLRPNGHMFHIDFGFAFGRDPKSFAAPVRISSEMIDAMGGKEGEDSFRRHCWEALRALRGQAALILSVIGLMADAAIPDLSKLQIPSNVLAGIQDRLKLNLSDEEAERSLNTIIDESISALGPMFIEYFHNLKQQLRV